MSKSELDLSEMQVVATGDDVVSRFLGGQDIEVVAKEMGLPRGIVEAVVRETLRQYVSGKRSPSI